MHFLTLWSQSAITTIGLFWMAFWAFGLGYLISSMIQVFVTRKRMQQAMGKTGVKSVLLGSFFGFISSSCSFAALASTRSIFSKGAGLIPSLAFLLASTNLVIELGIVIAVFLSWQFIVGEYIGGIILILLMWLLVKFTLSKKLEKKARQHAHQFDTKTKQSSELQDWKQQIKTQQGWFQVAKQYVMEWKMVWKDVTIGFTAAGIIAVFVPKAFFESLFIGSGAGDPSFWQILAQTIVGPLAAFFTFIGSMGNIPLAAVLFSNGVSFAGIMAFIFSDLIVFPVMRIQAKYYGWKMMFYIIGVFIVILILTALILHFSFATFNLLPSHTAAVKLSDRQFFRLNHTFYLNILFILTSFLFFGWVVWKKQLTKMENDIVENILLIIAIIASLWLSIGVILSFII